MSADKYPSIFSRQMKAIVYICLCYAGSCQRQKDSVVTFPLAVVMACETHQRRHNCRSLMVIATYLKDKTIGGGRFLLSGRWDY